MSVFKTGRLMAVLMLAAFAVAGFAQEPAPPGGDAPPPQSPGRAMRDHERGGRDRGGIDGLHLGPPGRWWDDSNFAGKIGITADQKKKMDDIFNSSRLKLIDLMAGVQKEEAIMEPAVQADPPEEAKVLAQIDKVAQARAELEKANARMLFDLRRQLTREQWTKLEAERPPAREHGRRGERGDGPPQPPPPPGADH